MGTERSLDIFLLPELMAGFLTEDLRVVHADNVAAIPIAHAVCACAQPYTSRSIDESDKSDQDVSADSARPVSGPLQRSIRGS